MAQQVAAVDHGEAHLAAVSGPGGLTLNAPVAVREREARPSGDPAARALATADFVLGATPEDPDDLRDEYADERPRQPL